MISGASSIVQGRFGHSLSLGYHRHGGDDRWQVRPRCPGRPRCSRGPQCPGRPCGMCRPRRGGRLRCCCRPGSLGRSDRSGGRARGHRRGLAGYDDHTFHDNGNHGLRRIAARTTTGKQKQNEQRNQRGEDDPCSAPGAVSPAALCLAEPAKVPCGRSSHTNMCTCHHRLCPLSSAGAPAGAGSSLHLFQACLAIWPEETTHMNTDLCKRSRTTPHTICAFIRNHSLQGGTARRKRKAATKQSTEKQSTGVKMKYDSSQRRTNAPRHSQTLRPIVNPGPAREAHAARPSRRVRLWLTLSRTNHWLCRCLPGRRTPSSAGSDVDIPGAVSAVGSASG